MESHPTTICFLSDELDFRDFAPYRHSEEEAPAPATNSPWMQTVFDRPDWNARLSTDQHAEPAAPCFPEVPQVLQAPALQAPPGVLWPYPDQSLVSLPLFER